MKKIITTRKNGTKRVQIETDKKSKVDHSMSKMLNINSIMDKYSKTGVLPQFKQKVAQYMDTTEIPSYMEAHELITGAHELFMEFPSDIRKLMDNDPANMEAVLNNPEYKDLLIDRGILEKVQEPEKVPSQKEVIKEVVTEVLATQNKTEK